jgi:hypothetical protein
MVGDITGPGRRPLLFLDVDGPLISFARPSGLTGLGALAASVAANHSHVVSRESSSD